MKHVDLRTALLVASASLFPCAHAGSGSLAYDGFSYPLGSLLAGQAGGVGWSAPWVSVPGNSGASIVPGLGYTDANGGILVTEGGAVQTRASTFLGQETRSTVNAFGASGSSTWVSFLLQQAPNPNAGISYGTVALGQGLTFGSNAMAGGVGGLNPAVAAFYNQSNAFQLANLTIPAGSVTFFVLRYDFAAAGNDTISLWVNPLLSSVSATPDAVGSFRDYAAAFGGITLAYGDNKQFIYDELRIGASYSAVAAAVPEPGAAALLLAGIALLAWFVPLRRVQPRQPAKVPDLGLESET